MSKWIVAGLVALNLVLGLSVWMRLGGESKAYGQIGAATPSYATISGYFNNGTTTFLMDGATGRLAAVQVDATARRITPVGTRNVAEDLQRTR